MTNCTFEPLTEKLLSCYQVKGFSSLLVCFTFIFVAIFIRYIGVDFTFGILDCVYYNEDFVILRFCSIHFTVTLAALKNVVRYTEDFVESRLHCRFFIADPIFVPKFQIPDSKSVTNSVPRCHKNGKCLMIPGPGAVIPDPTRQ